VTRDAVDRGPLRARLERLLLRRFFLRWHMTAIVAGTVAAGVLAGKGLLLAGMRSMPLRWGLAVLASYGAFFGLVRLWVLYVGRHRGGEKAGPDLDGIDIPFWAPSSGGGGGGPAEFQPGGGQMGGGGASASFEGDVIPARGAGGSGGSGGGKGSWLGSLDFDIDGEGLVVLLALAVLVLGIVVAGGYVIYVAPEILSEVAFQTILAGPLARRGRRLEAEGWTGSVLRRTVIPFLVVLVVAIGAGALAHWACPAGATILQKLAQCG
jgi:hypothetical protein